MSCMPRNYFWSVREFSITEKRESRSTRQWPAFIYWLQYLPCCFSTTAPPSYWRWIWSYISSCFREHRSPTSSISRAYTCWWTWPKASYLESAVFCSVRHRFIGKSAPKDRAPSVYFLRWWLRASFCIS